jgi:hypothetical protein
LLCGCTHSAAKEKRSHFTYGLRNDDAIVPALITVQVMDLDAPMICSR